VKHALDEAGWVVR